MPSHRISLVLAAAVLLAAGCDVPKFQSPQIQNPQAAGGHQPPPQASTAPTTSVADAVRKRIEGQGSEPT